VRQNEGDKGARQRLKQAYLRTNNKEDLFALEHGKQLKEMGEVFAARRALRDHYRENWRTMTPKERGQAGADHDRHIGRIRTLSAQMRRATTTRHKGTSYEEAHRYIGRNLRPHHVGGDDNHRDALAILSGFHPLESLRQEHRGGYRSFGTSGPVLDRYHDRLQHFLDHHGHSETHEVQKKHRGHHFGIVAKQGEA
jgi:hypothetical protein